MSDVPLEAGRLADVGAPLAVERVETARGHFEVAMAGATDAEELALLLHGFPESFYSWRHQIPLFERLGYRCWAPNQRGYGNSLRPDGIRSYTLDHLVDDVGALIDASGCRRVTLVGHDWGGMVAWMSALRGVRPIERLAIMNFPHPRRLWEQLHRPRQLARSWYMLFFQLPWLPEWLLTRRHAHAVGQAFETMAVDASRFPNSVLDVYRDNACIPGAMRAMVHWYRALRHAGAVPDELRRAPPLKTPTLLIWGEADDALGLELTRGTDTLVENLTLRTLPRVSHWVQQEAPEVVNEIVEAWLLDAPATGSPSLGGSTPPS